MRTFCTIFASLLGLGGVASAQQLADPRRWDVSGSAALFEVRPGDANPHYRDDWYFNGRYAVAIGRFWSEHLKTELEYATSGEGSIYLQQFTSLPGNPAVLPYAVRSFHRVDQLSARLVYQFRDNAWIHPYVSGGLVGERDRHRVHIPPVYQYSSGRSTDPVILVHERHSAPTWQYRIGVTAAAGAKIYLSRNAFFNTGVIGTWSRPAATVSILAGFGIDF